MTTKYVAEQLGRAIIDAVNESMSEDESIPVERIENFNEAVEDVVGNMNLEVEADNVSDLDDKIESKVDADFIWDAIEDKVGERVIASANKEWILNLLRDDSEIQSILKFKIRAYLRENLRVVVREILTDFLRSTEQSLPDHAIPVTGFGDCVPPAQRGTRDSEFHSDDPTVQITQGAARRVLADIFGEEDETRDSEESASTTRTNGEGAIISGDPQVPSDDEIPF